MSSVRRALSRWATASGEAGRRGLVQRRFVSTSRRSLERLGETVSTLGKGIAGHYAASPAPDTVEIAADVLPGSPNDPTDGRPRDGCAV